MGGSLQASSKLKIAVVTGSRADYGIYYPLLKALECHKGIDLQIIITSSHLKRQYGRTADEVVRDFPNCTSERAMFYWGLLDEPPDWSIVLGDRREMLTLTIGAAYENIAIAHIYGGDRTGTIDEPARHAITRFAHIHFPCTQQSADRLIKMGEEPWRVKVAGPLGIYAMSDATLLPKERVCQELGLDATKEIILVIQHPVSTQIKESGRQMQATLEAVQGLQVVVIYPNSDPGSDDMIKEIESYIWIKKFKSLPYLQFISLLKASSVVVGNSSTGLYEAPLFGVPTVNVGNRQQDREHGENVIECQYHNVALIREALDIQIRKGKRQYQNPFKVNVNGVQTIINTLLNTSINERLLQKRLIY